VLSEFNFCTRLVISAFYFREPHSALGPLGSSFGVAPIGIHHLLLSNLTTDCHPVYSALSSNPLQCAGCTSISWTSTFWVDAYNSLCCYSWIPDKIRERVPGQQLRTPDGQKCWAGNAVRQVGDGCRNTCAASQRRLWMWYTCAKFERWKQFTDLQLLCCEFVLAFCVCRTHCSWSCDHLLCGTPYILLRPCINMYCNLLYTRICQ